MRILVHRDQYVVRALLCFFCLALLGIVQPALVRAADAGTSCGLPKRPDALHTVTVTPDLLLGQFKGSVGASPQWVPGTSSILFSFDGWIDILDTRSDACRAIIRGGSPILSPDGKHIAFLDKGRQIVVAGIDGSKMRTITNVAGGLPALFAWAWTPESQGIVYGYQASSTNPLMQFPKGSATIPTVLDIGAPKSGPPDGIIQLISIASGARRTLASGPYSPGSFTWLGEHLVYSAAHYGSEYNNGKWWAEVRELDPATGKQIVLVANHGVQHLQPVASPRGDEVAFADDPNNVYYPYNLNVATVGAKSKRIVERTTNTSFPHFIAGRLKWSPDGRYIYFLGKSDVFTHIYRVDAAGHIVQIDRDLANAGSYDFSPDGKRLVWSAEDGYGHSRIMIANADGSARRVLADLRPSIDTLRLGQIKLVHYRSKDGVINSGLVVLPVGYNPRHKYPLIVDLHGGPDGGIALSGSLLLQNPLEWQMWASRGFIVLVADYRSSEVAGWNTYVRALRGPGSPLQYDFEDIMAAVDYTIAHYAVNPRHMAVYGHSNGGIETNWIITHTHRFRVAVSYEGDADQYIAWSSGFRIGGNPAETWEYGGTPVQVPQRYLADSAAMHVKGVTIPTLFISGENGIALFHNEFLYGAWLSQHVPVDYVIYGGEGHVVMAPANVKDLLWRAIHWIARYL